MANLSDVITAPLLNRFLSKITPAWLGLGNVENTSDSEKYVAYASNSGEATNVKNTLTIRFKGGRTEGTDMWTFNGASNRSINITAAKIGAVASSQGTANAGKILYVNADGEVAPLDLATLKSMLDSMA